MIPAVVLIPILLKSPSHDRPWKVEQAVLPYAEFAGDLVTIDGIRDFSYAPDASIQDAAYTTGTYDLGEISSLWYGISVFSDFRGLAHTFLSFGFEDGRYLAISIEARQEVGESYNPFHGLLRRYDLIYVLAEERDVIGLRSHIRGETVHLYEFRMEAGRARQILEEMLSRTNEIRDQPEFYNTLTHNCMTGIVERSERISAWQKQFDYRILLPGYSDGLAQDLELIPTDVPLADLRAQARIRPEAASIDDPDFSRKIRGLAEG